MHPLPPGPKPVFRGGLSPMALLAFWRDPPGFLRGLAARYGDVVYIQARGRTFWLLSHPDDLEELFVRQNRNFTKGAAVQLTRHVMGNGLLSSEGEFHLRQRRLMQPMFHRHRIEGYGEAMVGYAGEMAERWRAGMRVDIAQEMLALTLSIVGKTLFGSDVGGEALEVSQAMQLMVAVFEQVNSPLTRLYSAFNAPLLERAETARLRLLALVDRLVDEHRASGDRGDVMSMLLAAQHEDSGQGMTNAQVRDEAMTLFLAGHETTANALIWTWYLLSQNPAAEAGLQAELEAVLAGRRPSAQDLPRLEYTRMVAAEAMRLYPPGWQIGRTTVNEFEVGGYVVPARSNVLTSQWVVHHDARWYPGPFAFRPERWLPEAQAARPKFAYFPFGGGPRLCIGEQFAWMELVLVIATLAQRWRLRLVPGQRVAVRPSITLRPKYGMVMVVEKR